MGTRLRTSAGVCPGVFRRRCSRSRTHACGESTVSSRSSQAVGQDQPRGAAQEDDVALEQPLGHLRGRLLCAPRPGRCDGRWRGRARGHCSAARPRSRPGVSAAARALDCRDRDRDLAAPLRTHPARPHARNARAAQHAHRRHGAHRVACRGLGRARRCAREGHRVRGGEGTPSVPMAGRKPGRSGALPPHDGRRARPGNAGPGERL